MDTQLSSASPSDTGNLAIAGWAALEHGNLEAARAALQDLYSLDPTHPALPLLAAGIRRTRPKRFPWRAIILMLVVIAVGILAVQSWRGRVAQSPASTSVTAAARSRPETPIAPPPAPAESPVGTSGPRGPAPVGPAPRALGRAAAVSEDDLIRQAISRFTAAYSSKWTPLTLRSCDIARGEDTANVTCQSAAPRSAAGASAATWVFSCRKVEEGWKIVSIQPPPDTPQ
jgi:hypothetical protein